MESNEKLKNLVILEDFILFFENLLASNISNNTLSMFEEYTKYCFDNELNDSLKLIKESIIKQRLLKCFGSPIYFEKLLEIIKYYIPSKKFKLKFINLNFFLELFKLNEKEKKNLKELSSSLRFEQKEKLNFYFNLEEKNLPIEKKIYSDVLVKNDKKKSENSDFDLKYSNDNKKKPGNFDYYFSDFDLSNNYNNQRVLINKNDRIKKKK